MGIFSEDQMEIYYERGQDYGHSGDPLLFIRELAGICVISQTNLILLSPRYLSSSLMISVIGQTSKPKATTRWPTMLTMRPHSWIFVSGSSASSGRIFWWNGWSRICFEAPR